MDTFVYCNRRNRLLESLKEGIAFIPAALEVPRSRDTAYPFRQDSYFYYLTGFNEPEAVLVLRAGKDPKSILFCRPKDPERETWEGKRLGVDAAKNMLGVDKAYAISELDEKMPELLSNQPKLAFALDDARWMQKMQTWVNIVHAKARQGSNPPEIWHDIRHWLDAMRQIKDEHELKLLEEACTISAKAQIRAMETTRPGQREYEVEAELLYAYHRHGACPSYLPICAGGSNALILHYIANRDLLREGSLILIDAGAEYQNYCGDITRTFPVGKRFSTPQKELYSLVLQAQQAAIAEVRAGKPFDAPHLAAVRILTAGLIDLGVLTGDLDEAIAKEVYKRFYIHRTSHWLGMDVHDCGAYKDRDGKSINLQPSMVLTIEPGLYMPDSDDVPACYRGIGIRIEDDVVVTDGEPWNLTAVVPKAIDDVEALR